MTDKELIAKLVEALNNANGTIGYIAAQSRLNHAGFNHVARMNAEKACSDLDKALALAADHKPADVSESYKENLEIADIVTVVMREADPIFEKTGGSTRHYVRDLLLPMLHDKGLGVLPVKPPAQPKATTAEREAALEWFDKLCNDTRFRYGLTGCHHYRQKQTIRAALSQPSAVQKQSTIQEMLMKSGGVDGEVS